MTQQHSTKKRKNSLPPIFYIILGVLCFVLVPRLWGIVGSPFSGNADRFSLGEQLLIPNNPTTDKQKGVEAFAKGDYQQASEHFEKSLLKYPNDPETLIYLNNAQAGENPIKIAASVPISSNLNISQEILRGVAQAQDEINRNGGIEGRKLQVEIADDRNDPEIARQIAKDLVNDRQVIAVIGHNASNASLAAAPIYQQGGLVMVTPTSFANNLSGIGNYIFRIVPNTTAIAEVLADYVVNTARKTKIAFCYDSQAPDNVSFKDEFLAAVVKKGGQLIPTVCDLAAPNFNPTTAVEEAISSGADALFVVSHIDRLQTAIDLAKANRGRLPLFSSPTMYTIKTLQAGQKDVNGLVLVAPWHPQVNPSFAEKMRQRWRGRVGWRTATAYDATQAIIEGLKQSNSRDLLPQVLHRSAFTFEGASGMVKFTPTGDRLGSSVIIQVQPQGGNYDFVRLK